MSPFQQQVIDATGAQLQNQDAQQQNTLTGNAISAGAWGGDRAGVAQAQLAGQQSIANNLTFANLNNTNYQQALATAQNQQNIGLQTQIANQELGVQGANALLSAGNTLQQNQQLSDIANYQQYQNQQQYPFQTTQYLANILGGIQGGAGGTTTQTQSGNLFSDLFGGALGIAGLFTGKKDGGKVNDEPKTLADLHREAQQTTDDDDGGALLLLGRKDGGNIRKRAVGGLSGLPFGSYVPSGQVQATPTQWAQIQAQSQNSPLSALFGITKQSGMDNIKNWLHPDQSAALDSYVSTQGQDLPNFLPPIYPIGHPSVFDIGNTVEYANGGKVRGYADGGMPYAAGPSPFVDDSSALTLADLGPIVPQNVAPLAPNSMAQTIKPAATLANPMNDNSSPQAATAGVKSLADIQNDQSWMGQHYNNPLLNAGLAILAGSHDPNAAAIGKGGMSAIQGYTQNRQQQMEAAKEAHQQNYQDQKIDLGAKKLQQEATQFGKELDYKTAHDAAQQDYQNRELAQTGKYQAGELANARGRLGVERQQLEQGRYQWQPGTQLDPATNQPISGMWRLPTRGGEVPQFVTGAQLTGKSGSGGSGISGREGVFFNRITGAGNAATAAAENIMELPITVDRGFFGGREQGGSLFDATKEDLANTLTGSDAQGYNTMMAGVGRNLSAIEAAGLAPNGSLTHSMDSLILKEGDSQMTRLRKMAEMRQIIETGMEPSLSNPRIPPEQKELVQKIVGKIRSAIPFTQHDITQLERAKNPRATIGDFAKQSGIGGSPKSVVTKSDFDALASGTVYIGKDGNQYRKP